MSMLEKLYRGLSDWKKLAWNILRCQFTENQIHELCLRYRDAPTSGRTELDDEAFYSLYALIQSTKLEDELPPPGKGYVLTDESAAEMIGESFLIGLFLCRAGGETMKEYAEQQLKFVEARRKTRNIINDAREDIESAIDDYLARKGVFPPNFNAFIKDLVKKDSPYTSYKTEGNKGPQRRIKCTSWEYKADNRSLRTIEGWFYEYRNKKQIK